MDSTKESKGLLDKIIPPRLEDAGLEDCALPPDSIQEAFLKATDAVKSRAAALFDASDDETEVGCVADPWFAVAKLGAGMPSPGASDMVVVGGANCGDADSCGGVKGGRELAEDDRRSCGGGLKGLGVQEMEENRGKKAEGGEEEEEEEEKQILVEGVE